MATSKGVRARNRLAKTIDLAVTQLQRLLKSDDPAVVLAATDKLDRLQRRLESKPGTAANTDWNAVFELEAEQTKNGSAKPEETGTKHPKQVVDSTRGDFHPALGDDLSPRKDESGTPVPPKSSEGKISPQSTGSAQPPAPVRVVPDRTPNQTTPCVYPGCQNASMLPPRTLKNGKRYCYKHTIQFEHAFTLVKDPKDVDEFGGYTRVLDCAELPPQIVDPRWSFQPNPALGDGIPADLVGVWTAESGMATKQPDGRFMTAEDVSAERRAQAEYSRYARREPSERELYEMAAEVRASMPEVKPWTPEPARAVTLESEEDNDQW